MIDKQNKMFPKEVILPKCPKCGKHRIVKEKEYEFCLVCEYSTLKPK